MFYFSALFFAFLLGCIAFVESVRPQSISPLKTKARIEPYGYGESKDSTEPQLLDVVLVASVDGKLHALNRTSGQTLWSMSNTGSDPSSLGPLVRTQHVESDPDLTEDGSPHNELYVIEPQSGDIFVMATASSPLQRLPFSMAQLVEISPFSFPNDDDHRVFVGKKETSLLVVELETGKIITTIDSSCPWDPYQDTSGRAVDLDELEDSSQSIPREVYIGRTDYHITIHTLTDKSMPRPPVQNLSFSTYGPNNQDQVMQSAYTRTADETYVQSLPDGAVVSFKARSVDSLDQQDSRPLWSRQFQNPVVAVFDVLQTPNRQHPFVLLQPQPDLQDFMPGFNSKKVRLDLIPNLQNAFVGIVDGSLFAMSPEHYPLVAFGGIHEPQSNTGRLIEAPRDSPFGDIPHDAATRRRKLQELCARGWADRRCLTGVRKLESASDSPFVQRLLDGVPTVQSPEVSSPSAKVETLSELTPRWPWAIDEPPTPPVQGRMSIGSASALSAVTSLLLAVGLWFVATKTKSFRSANPQQQQRQQREQQAVPVRIDEFTKPLPMIPTEDNIMDDAFQQADSVAVMTVTQFLEPSEDTGTESDFVKVDADSGEAPPTPGKKKKQRRGGRGAGGKGKNNSTQALVEPIAPELAPMSTTPLPVNTPSALVFPSTPKLEPVVTSLIVSDTILGWGSHGTVVYQGSLQGRAVAVKRLLQDFVTLAAREVSILQESDDHPNVIRYYYQESHASFLYIALELCPASLADIIERPNEFMVISIAFEPKRALRQIASGLRHLHALKLVHRDIKPQNILISSAKKGSDPMSGHRMLISDFGLCKKLDVDQTSFLPTAHGAMAAGTVGWRAPEILRGEVKLDEGLSDEQSMSSRGSVATVNGNSSGGVSTGSSGGQGKPTRLTKSVDIFALGCLFYYTLTNGGHPYGDRYSREVNILKDEKNLDGLERFGEEGSEAADLITTMLHPEAKDRPDTTTCLLHPFFWDPGRRLNFLQDASDRFEIMTREPRDPDLVTLEKGAVAIVGIEWHSRLDKIFIDNLGKFRKYDGRSVQDLLRALRNKKHHYQDLPDHVKRHLGPMPEGYLSYFTKRYPLLFLHVHSVIAATNLHRESMFRSYFELAE